MATANNFKRFGASNVIVNTASRLVRELDAAKKAQAKGFTHQVKAAEALSAVRDWYDQAKKDGEFQGNAKWYEFVLEEFGLKKAWAARLLQIDTAISNGASVEDYLEHEGEVCKEGDAPQASALRFLRWVKDGTLEVPEEVEEVGGEESDGEESDGGETGGGEPPVHSFRSAGAVVDVFADGRVEAKGENVAEALASFFGAVANLA
jgi:hypothetical protein